MIKESICGAVNTINQSSVWLSPKPKPHDVEGGESNVEERVGVIAYALHNTIAIVEITVHPDPTYGWKKDLLCTIRGHKGMITALVCPNNLYHSNESQIVELISGSEDGTVKIWRCNDFPNKLTEWYEVASFNENNSTIIALSSLSLPSISLIPSTIFAAADSGGKIAIWCGGNGLGEYDLIETFNAPPAQMANAIHFSFIPSPSSSDQKFLSLIIGGVDAKVHLRIATYTSLSSSSSSSSSASNSLSKFISVGALFGHEEWITSISTQQIDDSTLLIATASQDSKIRIWKIAAIPQSVSSSGSGEETHHVIVVEGGNVDAGIGADDDDDGDDIDAEEGAVELIHEEVMTEARLVFGVGSSSWRVFFDALLLGHEDWVTSVHWMIKNDSNNSNNSSNSSNNNNKDSELLLFSTSMDRNMILWGIDNIHSGVWTPLARIGDVGGSLGGSVGGNLLGFTSGCISSTQHGEAVCGIGFGGSMHLWRRKKNTCTTAESLEVGNSRSDRWFPEHCLTGHFGPVNDICWSHDGSFIVSVSSDQTCRLFAPIVDNITESLSPSSLSSSSCWREISRPQIHGYDLNSIALSPSHLLFSGGDEKIIRVFEASQTIIEGLNKLCQVKSWQDSSAANRITKAFLPELGLSNRASDLMTKQEAQELESRNVSILDWNTPPLEGQLSDHTLWPEIKKLYGHGNDVVCTSLSNDGCVLATACKARTTAAAAIILWDTTTMLSIQTLQVHDSTVVSLRFSPDDTKLASSGKDRTLCVFQRDSSSIPSTSTSSFQMDILGVQRNAHKRIVWDCAWAPESNFLVTASRDGTCKIWCVCTCDNDNKSSGSHGNSNNQEKIKPLICIHTFSPFGSVSVTSVDLIRRSFVHHQSQNSSDSSDSSDSNDHWLIAVGAESGDISVINASVSKINSNSNSSNNNCGCKSECVSECKSIVASNCAHGAGVKRLRWRPPIQSHMLSSSVEIASSNWLASCGDDHTLRVFRMDQNI